MISINDMNAEAALRADPPVSPVPATRGAEAFSQEFSKAQDEAQMALLTEEMSQSRGEIEDLSGRLLALRGALASADSQLGDLSASHSQEVSALMGQIAALMGLLGSPISSSAEPGEPHEGGAQSLSHQMDAIRAHFSEVNFLEKGQGDASAARGDAASSLQSLEAKISEIQNRIGQIEQQLHGLEG